MGRTMVAAIICTMFALPAVADTISGGKVIAVSDGGKSFKYRWKHKNLTFKTTDKTVVQVDKQAGTWSDIKAGQAAQIQFYREGNERYVLVVGIGF